MKTKQPQPIDRLNVHHVGIATNNLDRLTDEYLRRGYRIINEVYDTKQKARLRLLSKDNQYNIELIYTKDPKSRVFNLSRNNYKKEYHICFEVKNIDSAVNILRKDGYSLVTDIEIAKLFSGKICFMYKNSNLIELVELI